MRDRPAPGRPGPLTYGLLGVLGVFAAGDAAAHYTHYRYGETVSAATWWLEHRYPAFHLVVGAGVLTLFTHLEFKKP